MSKIKEYFDNLSGCYEEVAKLQLSGNRGMLNLVISKKKIFISEMLIPYFLVLNWGACYFSNPIPYSLFPIPYSLFPIPYSLFPIPYSLFPPGNTWEYLGIPGNTGEYRGIPDMKNTKKRKRF